MKIKFKKMHGTGNDFILLNRDDITDESGVAQLSRALCRRHFGIGADGLLAMGKSDIADCRMDMYNPDGTPSNCGNGLRCAAVYALEQGLVNTGEFTIESQGRVMSVKRDGENIAVNMGEPVLEARDIPVAGHTGRVVKHPFNFGGVEYEVTCVSLGNPHAVIYVDDLDYYEIEQLGPIVENSRHYFPDRINCHLAQVIDRNEVMIKIWERGAGATLSCGTGSVATVVAGVLNEVIDRKARVDVPGGVLEVEYPEEGGCILSGPVNTVFEGYIEV